ncbi:MAG: hypothetical protein CSA31_01280 [Desulfobulbus propionicus]|nr:MAG: hypothetical protein CSA31_01280 [Desulfobulbus propionicus]
MYNCVPNRFFLVLLSLLMPIVFALPLNQAKAGPKEQELVSIQKRYRSMTSISFSFLQQTTVSGRLRTGEGNAVFLRNKAENSKNNKPDTIVMRWDYLKPSVQTIVNTGNEISIYTKDDKQLIISSADQLEADIVYAVFSGNTSLDEAFIPAEELAEEVLTGDDTTGVLHVRPSSPHPQLQRLTLWYSPDYIIKKIAMEDQLGSVTTLSFSRIAIDSPALMKKNAGQAIAHIAVPEDTEIIRQ